MQAENDNSDNSDTLYMLGSDASDTYRDQNNTEDDDDDVLYQLNDSMHGSADAALVLPQNASPIDMFRLFLTPELVSYIVDQSNLYRIQSNKTKQDSMTESDFYSLLRSLFYSFVLPLPSKRDYWSSFCRQTMVADVITRDRIIYLLSILHFHDNAIEKDKAGKVVPLMRYSNKKCKVVVDSERDISIDEQMIGYKGKTAPTSLRRYMPKKPTKRGFKV